MTKHLHCLNKKNEAFTELQRLVQYNLHPLVLSHYATQAHAQQGMAGALPVDGVNSAVGNNTGVSAAVEQNRQILNKLMAKCYLKLGDWLKEIQVYTLACFFL